MEELTSWVPPQDEFTDLVIDEDEEAVGDSTAPPQDPEEKDRAQIDMGGADTKKLAANSQQARLLQDLGGCGWVGGDMQEQSRPQGVHAQSYVHSRTVGQERSQSCLNTQAEDQHSVPGGEDKRRREQEERTGQ